MRFSPWQPTCRTSDENVDYLELTMELAGGLRIERHLVLARKDRFLLLADAVLGTRPGALAYRGLLPLGPGIALGGAGPTRERFLVAARASRPGERLATVLPLALPEWRRDHGVGELSSGPEGMELRQAIEGRRLFAPLWLDLDPGRIRRRRTWRQLTVAESLRRPAARRCGGLPRGRGQQPVAGLPLVGPQAKPHRAGAQSGHGDPCGPLRPRRGSREYHRDRIVPTYEAHSVCRRQKTS